MGLNRCAELAVEKGFAGFEILSDTQFAMQRQREDDRLTPRPASAVPSLRTCIPVSPDEAADVAIWGNQADLASRSDDLVKLAHGGGVVFYGGGGGVPKPGIEGDVHFLPGPIEPAPAKSVQRQGAARPVGADPQGPREVRRQRLSARARISALPKGKLK